MPTPRPKDLKLLRDWNLTAKTAFALHYICGIAGVAASTYAATSFSYAQVGAVVSGVCFAVLGFLQPMNVYHKFMCGARILEPIVDRYGEGLVDIATVIEARQKAELSIQRLDEIHILKKPKA